MVAFFIWWYSRGWKGQFSRIRRSLSFISNKFSLRRLTKTIFSEFCGGGFFSRIYGALIRLAVIIVGVVVWLVVFIAGVLSILIWPTLPVLPIIYIIIAVEGYMPWI